MKELIKSVFESAILSLTGSMMILPLFFGANANGWTLLGFALIVVDGCAILATKK